MDISKLTLGTVQLGQAYGIANTTGQPSREDSYKILQTAYEQGLRSFDTARAYGDSEAVIGEWIKEFAPSRETYRLATKLAPLPAALANVAPLAAKSLQMSLKTLGVEKLDVFLFHRWSDRKNEAVFKEVQKYACHFEKQGVSTGDYADAIEALRDPAIQFIQLPHNILDWRGRRPEFLAAVAARPDVEIQARSILLQGLLSDTFAGPSPIEDFGLEPVFSELDNLCKEFDRLGRTDLAVAYASGVPWISSIVFGVDNIEQLKINLKIFNRSPLKKADVEEAGLAFVPTNVPEKLLNPAQWNLKKEYA